jgi:glucosylceramidase
MGFGLDAPTWMKTNGAFDGGAIRDEPTVYAACALYLAKFVAAYRAEGVDLFMVVPQNEPGQITHYPSCDWQPRQYITFIRDHLGPTFQRLGTSARIWLGTINTPNWDVRQVLEDRETAAYIEGLCFQWGGLSQIPAVRAAFPDKKIMQSETDCGNWHWHPGFVRDRPPNDFSYGAYTWRKFRDFIAAGSSSYLLWNMVLDEQGKNLDSLLPWPQNAAIVVDRRTGQVVYTPMYHATRHFSGLVELGARVLESTGSYADRIAFINPDGSVLVELLNSTLAARDLSVAIGSHQYRVTLPGQSFATLMVSATACAD